MMKRRFGTQDSGGGGFRYGGGAGQSAPFTPARVPNAVLWTPAANISGVSDAATVSAWTNAIAGGANGDGTLDGLVPTYYAGGGDPFVRFNGSNNSFSFGNNFNLGTKSVSMFAVIRRAVAAGTIAAKTLAGGVDGRYSFVFNGSSVSGGYYSSDTADIAANGTAIALETDFVLMELHLDRVLGTMEFCINAASIDTQNFTPDANVNRTNSEDFRIGRYASNANLPLNADLKNFFMVQQQSGAVSSANRALLRAYFKNKHALVGY